MITEDYQSDTTDWLAYKLLKQQIILQTLHKQALEE